MSLLAEAKPQLDLLGVKNRAFSARYPGARAGRQPVHTVYGAAQHYRADSVATLGQRALQALRSYGGDPVTFARAAGLIDERLLADARQQALAATIHQRVLEKLQREPVEDFRIDFEDGFGARSDREEDAAAVAAAEQVALAQSTDSLPPFLGIRIKSFSEEWKARGTRTLELFLETLLAASGGKLPHNFVVTLPKVTIAEQPRTLVRLFEILEQRHGLEAGSLRMEIMIEVVQALLGPDGRSPLGDFLVACEGRCVGAQLGTYDFTASCNLTAAYQVMDHPLCDLAKGMMILAYAGSGIFLSDGATNVLPVEPHRGAALSETQREENRAAVHAAWRLSQRHIRHSLAGGFYQGWDLHGAQLPVRFGTCYAFFLEGLAQAAERLRSFVAQAASATQEVEVSDDAATGQGLLNYFLRARNCGALGPEDLAQTGLSEQELGLASFAKILEGRRARAG